MPAEDWQRVTKQRRCPICEKPDWCLVHREGTAVICARVSDGCHKFLTSGAGYLHRLDEGRDNRRYELPKRCVPSRKPTPEPLPIDWEFLVGKYCEQVNPHDVNRLAENLGVSSLSLDRLSIGYKGGGVWTFPMSNARREVIGLRIRSEKLGRKWAYPGSRNGLFIPRRIIEPQQLLICEGPTDTAAMLDLGFDAIGRPSCMGCQDMLRAFCRKTDSIVVADGDGPGREGAMRLAKALWSVTRTVKVIAPPKHKDVRDWVSAGATRRTIEGVIAATAVYGGQEYAA